MNSNLYRMVRGFRRGFLDGREPAKQCFMLSAALQGFLSVAGYETDLVEGCITDPRCMPGDYLFCEHYWLTLPSGTIIDATASQFSTPEGGSMPDVYIGPLPVWYQTAHAE